MPNTRVKNPKHREINRKIGRQKSAKIRASRRALLDPLDTEAQFREEVHKLKISEFKKERERVVKPEKT